MTDGGAGDIFAGILRLIPHSGVQFFDAALPRHRLSGVVAHFIEELFDAGGVPQRILLPIEARPSAATASVGTAAANDRLYHPVSGKHLDPQLVLTLDAEAALSRFAGRWLPFPYLRFAGRDDKNRPRLDTGPTNWTRLFIDPATVTTGEAVRMTLAFDTNLDVADLGEGVPYVAPTEDDAAFGSTFLCAETVEDISSLLAEPWLESWLSLDCAPGAASTSSRFHHQHIALYLTLLKALRASGVMPEARFTDTVQRRYPIRSTAVDLVLDLGDEEACALLVDVTDEPGAMATGYAELLVMRDLADPMLRLGDAVPTAVEFTAAPFGHTHLSRESGRLDAFAWPSLVRIGDEARRLSLRRNAAEGVTGLSDIRAFVSDDTPNAGLWRLSTDAAESGEFGPMVAGELLEQIAEDGTVLGTVRAEQARIPQTHNRPAIRPRFSRASLTSFFAAELVLHALAQLNAPMRGGRGSAENEVRTLRQVVVLASPSLTEDEQAALLARIDGGVELVWRGSGWQQGRPGVPQRPEVVASPGGDIASQVAFVHNEVMTKYQGRFQDLLRVYRNGAEGEAAERLRVASACFSPRETTVTVVDYGASEGPLAAGAWSPQIVLLDRLPQGTTNAAQALIWSMIIPAIEADLEQASLHPARRFIEELMGQSSTSLLVDDPYFTRRLSRKVLWPAARGLMALEEHAARSIRYGNRSVTLGDLVAIGGGRIDDVAPAFDVAALQAGARGFALASTVLRLGRDAIHNAIGREYAGTIEQLCRIVAAQDCDLLLLSGDGARLPVIPSAVLAALPLPASRIIDLERYHNQAAAEALGDVGSNTVRSAALLPAVATAMDRRHLLEAGVFGGQTIGLVATQKHDVATAPKAIAAPFAARERGVDRAPSGRSGPVPAKGG